MQRRRERQDERLFDEVFEEEFEKEYGMTTDESIEDILKGWEINKHVEIDEGNMPQGNAPDKDGILQINQNEAILTKYFGEDEDRKRNVGHRYNDGLIG